MGLEKTVAFFTVVLKFTDNADLIEQARSAHGAYLKDQVANGTVHIAGPFEDGTGGVLVAETADQAELKQLLDGDPYVSQGVVVDTQIYPFKAALGVLAG